MTFAVEATEIAADLTELRHSIHREPELGYDLPKTQQKVLGALGGLPLEITLGKRLSSVTAVLRGRQAGPTVLLRGDMDALPVTESTGLPFASEIDGAMHACGHDLHTAMLAGAARLLSARRDELPGNVIFMFQPAEEGGPDGTGGALPMIKEGVLEAAGDRPIAAYGLHVFSDLFGRGVFETRPGATWAASDTLDVTVRGPGGHGSMPHRAADPVTAACAMVTALQTMVTRRFDVFDPVVLTVGAFHAGTWSNIIPETAVFQATVRSFSRQAQERLRAETLQVVRGIAEAHGVTADADYIEGYPVTVNDPTEATFATATAASLFGAGRSRVLANPLLGAEDFSYVLNEVPGAFIMLGACPPGTDPRTAAGNHSPAAVFDDGVLADGAALYAELAFRRLTAGDPPAVS